MNSKQVMMIGVLVAFLTGCAGRGADRAALAGKVNVFGIELFSDVDYRQLNGVAASEEPCLKGYERTYDALDVIIGYGFDRKIRKIMTRNPQTSIFGIRPGMALAEGRQRLQDTGFREYAPPFTYRDNGYSLKFLVDGNNTIFGLTLESLD